MINFTKIGPSKDDKEDMLVLTDVFSLNSVSLLLLMVRRLLPSLKYLVDERFYICGIPSQFQSIKGE